MEVYDINNVKITGTPFGTSPPWVAGREFDKATDGNTVTFFDYSLMHFGFTGLDLGAGNEKRVSKVRFFPRAGYESRMNQGMFQGGNVAPVSVTVISNVETSDGRAVYYGYDTIPDPLLGQDWIVLNRAQYNDGTAATYNYTLKWSGQRPLLVEANDPRYNGAGTHIKYDWWTNSFVYGAIYSELNGVTGSTLTTFQGTINNSSSATNKVTYPNGKVETMTYTPGGMTVRVDGLGRTSQFAYGASNAGFMVSRTDPLGRVTAITPSLANNPLAITHPDGTTESWTRDSLDLILTHTDELGRVTTYTRNAQHRITRIDYPDGAFETMAYNAFGQPTSHTMRNGGTETSAYDARGLKLTATDALGNVTAYTYDPNDRPASMTDARGNTTSYTYNERGLLMQVSNPDNSTTLYTYDTYGNRASVTDELGNTMSYSYDEFNRVTSATDPLGRTTTYSYAIGANTCSSCHSDAQPTQVTLPSGRIIRMTYDVESQKTGETVGVGSADAATTAYAYDAAGNLASITDPLGHATSFTYDVRNRRVTATDPVANTSQWTYDAVGNKLTVTRPDNGVMTVAYDAMNRVTQTTDPAGNVTSFGYDSGGNQVSLTDARNNSYGFTYDLLSRKTSMIYPGGSHEDWAYDATGNTVSYTTRAGQVKTCTFDNRNRDTLCDWSDATPDVTNTYDVAGRVLTTVSSVSALSYSYDTANQLLSETQQIAGQPPRTMGYTYDADGNRAGLAYPGGTAIGYSYTARNQLATVSADGPPPMATYAYDLDGQRITKALENGTLTSYAYDNANRLLSVNHTKASASFAKFDYGYNTVGNRTYRMETNPIGTSSDVYNYDAIDEVTGVQYGVADPQAPANPVRTVGYTYDPVGNRTQVTDTAPTALQPASYTANNLNQYTALNGNDPTYDANGNLTGFQSTVSGLVWTYAYDACNRLLSASSTQAAVTFAYDSRNRCVARSVSGSLNYLTYDGWNLIEERDSTGILQKSYVHGAQVDEMLAMIRAVQPTPVLYQHDALGNVTTLTDSAGNVIERYAYDVYGNPTIKDGTGTTITASGVGNRFLFSGREWIAVLSLYDYRNRLYSQELGRFLQMDPIRFHGGDQNQYRFVGNSPLYYVDPFGLKVVVHPEDKEKLQCHATVVCCKGVPQIQLPWKGEPWKTKKCDLDPHHSNPATMGCIEEHEHTHARDYLKKNPDVCKDVPDGTPIGWDNPEEKRQGECEGTQAEYDCLMRKFRQHIGPWSQADLEAFSYAFWNLNGQRAANGCPLLPIPGGFRPKRY